MNSSTGPLARALTFVIVVSAAVSASTWFIVRAAHRSVAAESGARGAASSSAPGAASSSAPESAPLAELLSRPRVLFRNVDTSLADGFGKLAVAPLGAGSDPPGDRRVVPVDCSRLHFAAGRGICLQAPAAAPRDVRAHLLDAELHIVATLRLSGLVSRTRVAPDGKLAAVTLFINGHSYSDGEYSTQTTLIDLTERAPLGDLEAFDVERDGKPWAPPDRNLWGVTFARDSDRFYATLGTRSGAWLVQGSVSRRHLRVLHDHVECPSLSPDGRLIAYKKPSANPGEWRLALLDVATLTERPLPGETRSIDDQVEWLDDGHVLYKLGPDVLSLAIAGDRPASVWLARAASPAVLR